MPSSTIRSFLTQLEQQRELSEQLAQEIQNKKDSLYQSIRDPKQRNAVTIPLFPKPKSKIGELTGIFNIVLG